MEELRCRTTPSLPRAGQGQIFKGRGGVDASRDFAVSLPLDNIEFF